MDHRQALLEKLESYPRLLLADYPTPLEHLTQLSTELDRDIFIKRDDAIGPGLGGNKTRKLEYLMAEALASGANKVVTFGGLQSNHARITAATARKLGLEPHLIYFYSKPCSWEGNLLINRMLNARMHFIPLPGEGQAKMSLETTNRLVHLLAILLVGRHYFIPVGGHSWLGCLGYVRAALEIDAQVRQLGLKDPVLAVAAGTGGTLAGLLAGIQISNSSLRLIGIDVGRLWKNFPLSIANLINSIYSQLGYPDRITPRAIPIIESTYVGERYGLPTEAGRAAIRKLARLEGILLDPVYTAKAFAGLIDMVRHQHLNLGIKTPIIFLHTGGLPVLFAY